MGARVIAPAPEQEKREAILAAALSLFSEQGFHGTSVPEVAEKAKVGTGTIYRYFASKEALVNAIFQTWKSELARSLMEDFPLDQPPRQQFHVLWSRLARFAAEHRAAFAFLELHHHAPYLDEESLRVEMALLQPLHDFCAMAIEAQVFKALPPALLIAVVYGALAGVVKASWQGFLTLDAQTLEQAESCAWEAIRR